MVFELSLGRAGQSPYQKIKTKVASKWDRLSRFTSLNKSPAIIEAAQGSTTNDGPTTLQTINTQIELHAKELLPLPSDNREQGSTANDELTTLLKNNTQIEHNTKELLPFPSDDRPRTSESALARFLVGKGEIVDNTKKLRFAIVIYGFDKNGKRIRLVALFDSGSDSDFVTHKGYRRIQQELDVETEPLPTEYQHTYTSPMFKAEYKAVSYVSLRVHGGNIGLTDTQVSLALLADTRSDTKDAATKRSSCIDELESEEIDIILGINFIQRHGVELLDRIANSPESFTPRLSFAPIIQNKKSKST